VPLLQQQRHSAAQQDLLQALVLLWRLQQTLGL
jgi:hypothetical protein